jgi:hypothetical protein
MLGFGRTKRKMFFRSGEMVLADWLLRLYKSTGDKHPHRVLQTRNGRKGMCGILAYQGNRQNQNLTAEQQLCGSHFPVTQQPVSSLR